MRKRSVLVVVAAAILMGLGTCLMSKPVVVPAAGLQLCATISPLADWLRAVAGPDADVHCLVDGSKDPHHFEPSPQDAVRVSTSRAVFSVGLNLDEWADKSLLRTPGAADQLVLFETGDWIEARKLQFRTIAVHGTPIAGAAPGEEHHHHGDGDPHYWNDPRRAMIVVRRMADELIKLDSAHKSGYEQRRDAYLKELDKLAAIIVVSAKMIPP